MTTRLTASIPRAAANFTDLPDLAAERLGGRVLLANDEFFAPKESLLKLAKPVWREDEYTDHGKWMDGWETRRRRDGGTHDWCIIKLGVPGFVHGVTIDTAFFKGNFPEYATIEVVSATSDADVAMLADDSLTKWHLALAKSGLLGDTKNTYAVDGPPPHATHVRLAIYPDGGVARLRVHGEPVFDPSRYWSGTEVDVAAITNGGLVLACSDMFFGNRHNLNQPGRSTHMGDGWETKRRRGPGNDWIVVRLAARGTLRRLEIDTDHFKGNAPASCMVETADVGLAAKSLDVPTDWEPLLPMTTLFPHNRAGFDKLLHEKPVTHVRLSIYPDGGIARLRAFGKT